MVLQLLPPPEPAPRFLPELTGVHHCIKCLGETPRDEYFANDFICTPCTDVVGIVWPLASGQHDPDPDHEYTPVFSHTIDDDRDTYETPRLNTA